MKRVRALRSWKRLVATAAAMAMSASLMFDFGLPVRVNAEMENETADTSSQTSDDQSFDSEEQNDQNSDSVQTNENADESESTSEEPVSEDNPTAENPEQTNAEDAENEQDQTLSDKTVEKAEKPLTVENDNFILTLKPTDETAWNEAVKEHSGLKAELVDNGESLEPGNDQGIADGSSSSDSAQKIVLFSHNYTLKFTDETGTDVSIGEQEFKGELLFKEPQIESLYEEKWDPSETSEGDSETVIDLSVLSDMDEKRVSEIYSVADEEDLNPIEFVLKDGASFDVLAEVINPTFTVQYYVNSQQLTKDRATSSTNSNIAVIDSSQKSYGSSTDGNGSGGNLPQNGVTPKLVYMALDSDTKTATLRKTTVMEPFYDAETFNYHEAPNPHYFNKLLLNGNYKLKEIWILKDGKDSSSTNTSDWNVYPADSKFTNNPDYAASHPGVILITDQMTLRMVYDETTSSNQVPADFYDYDISNGKNTKGQFVTSTGGSTGYGNWGTAYGINSNSNYSSPNATTGKLAFGNVNTGTHLGKVYWTNNGKNNLLNKYNSVSYKGCTFGLASGLTADGDIQFSSGITAPSLFTTGSAVGKHGYEDSSLTFSRSGDTYVLQTAQVNINGQLTTTASNLDQFNHPGGHENIWSNNFWPMDQTPGVDGLSGGSTKVNWYGWIDSVTGNSTAADTNYNGKLGVGSFPPSDDKIAHNPLFGMQYDVNFELTSDYNGPLDYFFFGDDDMWVFLDGKPIVDIGGVHSSVGQYVNLWDYIPHGDAGKHELKFFYTERGLSGSTCYMQFTLPSVSTAQPEHDTGNLIIRKEADEDLSTEDTEYEFYIHLTAADGVTELPDEYAYTKFNADGTPIENNIILRDGQTFTLKRGEYILCSFLPDGSKFFVSETGPGNATQVVTTSPDGTQNVFYPQTGEDGQKVPQVSGTITKYSEVTYSFNNTNPKNKISVLKDVSAAEGEDMPVAGIENETYIFRLIKEDGTLLYPAETKYNIEGPDEGQSEEMTLNSSGLITLKKGQKAVFDNSYLASPVNYYVQELLPPEKAELYGQVQISGSDAEKLENETIDGTEYEVYQSEVKSTADGGSDTETVFDWNNILDAEKYGKIEIEKKVPDGVQSDQEFTFTVSLNGSLIPAGTEYQVGEDTFTFTDNGQLTLKPGEKAVIENILAGTEYAVKETDTPGFTAELENAAGTVGISQTVTVVAMNIPDAVKAGLKKVDSEGNEISSSAVFRLYSSLASDNKQTKEFDDTLWYLEKEISLNGSAQIDGLLPGAEYLLEEVKAPNGYALMDGEIYFSVNADGVITLREKSDPDASLSDDSLTILAVNHRIPGLPNTGIPGTDLMVGTGAVLAIGAAIIYRRRSKKQK